eukprot:SAG11_NODE_3419_length_2459_cov_5.175424_1_plen_138_part_00
MILKRVSTSMAVRSEGRQVDTGRTVLGYFFQYKPAKMARGLENGDGEFFPATPVGFGTSGFPWAMAMYLGHCPRVFWVHAAVPGYPGTWKKFPRFVHLYLESSYWIYRYKFYKNFRQGSICTTLLPKHTYFFTIIVR